MEEIRNRNAILTGASRGLGAHLARALAREGVNLALAARDSDALEMVRDEAASLGVDAVSVPTDLAESGGVETLAEAAERRLGPVDILVNNAGVQVTAPYQEYPPEHIEQAVQVNLLAPMLLTRAVLPGMVSRGRGQVVNVSSLAGKIGLPLSAPYGATKAALVMFTHSLRAELSDTPVGVSVICPGFVAEDGMYARTRERVGSAPKLLRPTTPQKVIRAVLRAIRHDVAEQFVNPIPPRPLSVFREIIPGSTPWLHRILGTTRFAQTIARGDSDGWMRSGRHPCQVSPEGVPRSE